jgi:hypothetical protein
MENLEMQDAFLGYLYGKNFGDTDPCLDTVDKWVKSIKLDRIVFWRQYEHMIKNDLIKFNQEEAVIRLTPKGTLSAEKSGIVAADLVSTNREARKKLMFAMAVHLSSDGPLVAASELIKEAKLAKGMGLGNLQLLVSMGYAKWQVPSERLNISPRVCAKAGVVGKAA